MIECDNCEYFEKEEGYCMAINCTPLNCDEPLPCEETDAVTLYVKGEQGECEGYLQGFL